MQKCHYAEICLKYYLLDFERVVECGKSRIGVDRVGGDFYEESESAKTSEYYRLIIQRASARLIEKVGIEI